MSLRIKVIQQLLDINEKLIFYPRLSAYYKRMIGVKNPLILDVGANKGQTISFFLRLFPDARIISFEPNYKLYKKLIEKFRHLSNVELINKGISNKNGKLILKETVTDETSTFEELNYQSNYLLMKSKILGIKAENMVAYHYEVDVIKLCDFVEDHQLKHIHVLKLDTEGHELKCLEGLFTGDQYNIEFIQLEHHHDDMYLNPVSVSEMIDLLQKNRFQLHRRIKHGFGDFDELLFKAKNHKE